MYAQIVSQPALLRDTFAQPRQAVHETLAQFQTQRWQMIYTAGCGDSFYAGLACEMAFHYFCRLPIKALLLCNLPVMRPTACQSRPLLLGISNSGQVSRSIEAVALARAAGVDTIAVTGNGSSGIADAAAASMAVPIAAMGRSPGIRSYTIQLLTLYLCAIRLGEMRQVLSPAEAERWRRQLRRWPTVWTPPSRLPIPWHARRQPISKTPMYGSSWARGPAMPPASSVRPNSSKVAAPMPGDRISKNGAIFSFLSQQEATPTCLIMPPGRSQDRMLEILPYVKGVGRYTLVVGYSGQSTIACRGGCGAACTALRARNVFSPGVLPGRRIFGVLSGGSP